MAQDTEVVKKKILIVDDEPDMRELLTMYLTGRGFLVNEAGDGVDGLESVKKARPDLVILDVMMPRMDGFQLLKVLKSDPEYSKMPVIMLTAKNDVDSTAMGEKLHADHYLTKPFDVSILIQFINSSISAN